MGLEISNSPNIELLDFNVIADLYDGVFVVDIAPSVFVAGGEAYVKGVKVKIVNPYGIAIKDYSPTEFDIEGDLSIPYEYTLPSNYVFGEYTVSILLVDEDDSEYEISKSFTLCSPNKENNTLKYGCMGATMQAKCREGKMIVILDSPPTYRGLLPNSTENNLELRYPTVSERAPEDVVLSNFSVPLFEGVYQLVGDVKVEYDLGDGVYVLQKYKVNIEKKAVCKLNECCIQGKLDELNRERKEACTDEQKRKIKDKIGNVLFLFQAAKNAQDCGEDPSEYILELEDILGCSCTCNCNDGQVGSTIPADDFTITGCGFTLQETGNTKNIHIDNYAYVIEAGDDTVEVSRPSLNQEGCTVTQTVKVKNITPDYCQHFKKSIEQGNTFVDYVLLGLKEDSGSCETVRIAAPTGFAVTGSNRKSMYGTMEWYDTLTAANTAASSGETVLIFNDTSETLTIKAGVNYMGIGLKSIGGLVLSTTTAFSTFISNLRIQGTATLASTVDTKVHFTNVLGLGDLTISGHAKVHGGVWLDSSKVIEVQDYAHFSDYYTERHVVYYEDSKGRDFTIKDTKPYIDSVSISNRGALVIHSANDVVITNAKVISNEYTAIYVNSVPDAGSAQLTHSTGTTYGSTKHGIYFHCGGELSSNTIIFTHCVGRSISGDGIQIVRAYQGEDNYESKNRFLVCNNEGYSTNRYGIYSISANMKRCFGFSETNYGIRVAGSDLSSVNCYLIECNAESMGAPALYANRDIRLVGGTFQTSWDDPSGHPIVLTKNVVRPTENYVIVGVKTIAVNTDPTCWAIKGDSSVNLRVSNCDFLNFFLDENVPAIDPNILLRDVNIDYYDNIS